MVNEQEISSHLMDFAVSTSLRMKIKVILMLVDAVGTFMKGLEKSLSNLEIRGRTEIIQTTAD